LQLVMYLCYFSLLSQLHPAGSTLLSRVIKWKIFSFFNSCQLPTTVHVLVKEYVPFGFLYD
jgi:hypothetical protein